MVLYKTESNRVTAPRSFIKLPPDLTQETYTLLPFAENIHVVVFVCLSVYWAWRITSVRANLHSQDRSVKLQILCMRCACVSPSLLSSVALPSLRLLWWTESHFHLSPWRAVQTISAHRSPFPHSMPRDERLLDSLPSATSTKEPPAVATLPCAAELGQALKLLATTATQSNWVAAMPESAATLDVPECTPMGTKLRPDGVIFFLSMGRM